jgi:hypothetical protein
VEVKNVKAKFILSIEVAATYINSGCKQANMSHTYLLYDYFCDCFLGNILGIFLKNL